MRIRTFVVAVVVGVMLTSCVMIGLPGQSSGVKVVLEPKEYEILGDVYFRGKTTSILGIVTLGGAQFNDLIREAKVQYGDVDDVINVSIDYEFDSFAYFVVIQTYLMRGLAVRYD